MRKSALVLVATAVTLAIAGQAQAKGLKVVGVCGVNACKAVDHRLTEWTSKSASYTRPAQYYVLRIGFEGTAGFVRRAYWLPDSGWFALGEWSQGCWYMDCWKRFGTRGEAALRRVAAGLEPFMPHLAEVAIAGEQVENPDAYLPLLGDLRWSVLPPEKLHLTRIEMRPDGANPWLRGPAILGYDPRHQVLMHGDAHFLVPDRLAASLFVREPSGRTAFYAGLGVSALAAIALLAFARRKRKESP
jgi:hypothetical protein